MVRDTSPALIYALAFFSGLAALVYELAWARMLALTFGSTTLSATAVIAGFMGGMGIGAALYHHVADRAARPLRAYGFLELGIAVSAGLLTMTFYALPQFFAGFSGTTGSGLLDQVVRFIAVLGLLLVPSMLMGATFPALCMVMIRSARGVDRHLGAIYGVNTIGAAVGVLLAGLVLVEYLGLTWTVRAANGLNLAVAIVALLLREPGDTDRVEGESAPVTAIPTALSRRFTGLVLVGSGFCTLSYEILWFRALRYLCGTSTYALTIVLFTFLAGLGLGSLFLRRMARLRSPEGALAMIHAAIAVLALVGMTAQVLILEMPALREHVSIFSGSVRYSPWWWRLTLDVILATATMMPATILMGLSFPLATRLFLGDVNKLGTRVGSAYLLANVGSILGAIVAAVLFLPLLGTIGGTKVSAAVNIALAGVILFALCPRPRVPLVATQIAAVIAIIFVIVMPRAVPIVGENLDGVIAGEVIFSEEGDLATVQVLENPFDSSQRAMTIDGFKIGWSDGFRGTDFYRKQLLIAHLPMVLDARIRHTLNVGLGSAATLKTLATYPTLETIDCVEISAAVVHGSKLFAESDVLDDPRVRLAVDDAVHYLLRSDRQYDLIVSDGKQEPFYSGNAILLCREFYEFARARLSQRGLFVQWIPLATLHSDFQTTLRTQCAVFEHVEVFYFPPAAVIFVASREPLAGRPQLPPDEYASLPVARDLAEHFITSPADLAVRHVASKTQIERVLDEGPISTWDHLVLDFSPFKATREQWLNAFGDNLALLLEAERAQAEQPRDMFAVDNEALRQSMRLLRLGYLATYRGDRVRAIELGSEALKLTPDDGAVRSFLNRHRQSAARSGAD